MTILDDHSQGLRGDTRAVEKGADNEQILETNAEKEDKEALSK
jgi:hypothetical protein